MSNYEKMIYSKTFEISKKSIDNFYKKFINSVLMPRFLFNIVISDADYKYFLNEQPSQYSNLVRLRRLFYRILEKLFIFWPRIINHFAHDQISHENYVNIEETAALLISTIERYCSPDMKILDLGCNCGRHLTELYHRGFCNLSGVDLSKRAINEFYLMHPEVANNCQISNDFFQRYLKQIDNNHFDVIYSHGATIELVHPSFDIIREMCRITKNLIILFVNEHDHGFPRFYSWEFKKNGFYMIHAIRSVGQCFIGKNSKNTNSLLVFKRLKD